MLNSWKVADGYPSYSCHTAYTIRHEVTLKTNTPRKCESLTYDRPSSNRACVRAAAPLRCPPQFLRGKIVDVDQVRNFAS